MPNAKMAFKTQLQYGDAATPEKFKTVAEVKEIDPPELSHEQADVTSHDSTAAEFLSLYGDEGEINIDCNFLNDATYTAVAAKVGGAASNWQVCFPNWGARTKTFTADESTEIITAATHGLTTGQPVRVSSSGSPEDLPAPLVSGTTYFVIWVDAGTLQLATTNALAIAGTAINITDAGTGTHTIQIGNRLSFAANVRTRKLSAARKGELAVNFKAKITGPVTLT